MKRVLFLLIILLMPWLSPGWGFYAHQRINRLAVFSLPPEMIGFYKQNIEFLTAKAVNPDQRRYISPDEAERHYIDLDVYGDSALYKIPRYWKDAVEMYTEDTLRAYGVVPWHVVRVKWWLTNAFTNQDAGQILRLSADLGHYIADANVPLHTTENYNGQMTGQLGIHGFWESRLPELFAENYNLFVGKAEYLKDPQLTIWEAITHAHLALDSVLRMEKEVTEEFGFSKKFVIEQRGRTNVRTYAQEFSAEYHRRMDGMVERRMKASIKMIADFWYTAWVDGGQPDLNTLLKQKIKDEKEELAKTNKPIKLVNHESGEVVGN